MHTPFSGKSGAYLRYRADYPPDAVALVIARAALSGDQVVVDLGSGTGLLAEKLLAHARVVYAVEPADDMRRAAEAALGHDPGFRSVEGTAERTGLPNACADAVTCGNAFHYFDAELARAEVRRVLRPGGRVVILFHELPVAPNAFMTDYVAFRATLTPENLVAAHSDLGFEERLSAFFDGFATDRTDLGETRRLLPWESFHGMFSSTSIAPLATDPMYAVSERKLRRLFEHHQRNGVVPFALRLVCVSGESPGSAF